jgi:hypothetical protein
LSRLDVWTPTSYMCLPTTCPQQGSLKSDLPDLRNQDSGFPAWISQKQKTGALPCTTYLRESSNLTVAAEWKTTLTSEHNVWISAWEMPKFVSNTSPFIAINFLKHSGFSSLRWSNNWNGLDIINQ